MAACSSSAGAIAPSRNIAVIPLGGGDCGAGAESWRRVPGVASGSGVTFLQVVVPEKLTVMSDHCAAPIVDPAFGPAVRLAHLMAQSPAASNYVDLVPALSAGREDLFLRTDPHWNYKGCYVAYRRLCASLQVNPRHDLLERPFLEFDAPGALGNKLIPPATEPIRVHCAIKDATRRWVNEVVTRYNERGGKGPVRGSQAIYENASVEADRRRLLLFGDSNCNFDPTQLTGMFAETFREVHFVWSSSLDWRHVENVKPDILICEIAERFLKRVVDDNFDIQATLAARRREP